jgi:hypothetical protein
MTNFRSKRGLAMLAGAGLMLVLSLSPATAQRSDDMRPGQGGSHPCAGDAQRLCSQAIPDRAKVASCLSQNRRQLSPACRAEMGGGKGVSRKAKGKRKGKRSSRRR